LIPAVKAARESSRRTQCANNLRNLALAAIQYENTNGELPGYVSRFQDFEGGPDPGDPASSNGNVPQHPKRGTWVTSLLPWLDAQPIYERWNEAKYPVRGDGSGEFPRTREMYNSVATPNLAIMQCPSSSVTTGDFGRNSYISNNGMHVLRGTTVTVGGSGSQTHGIQGRSVNFEGSMKISNGLFNNKYTLGHGPTNPQDMVELGGRVRLTDIKDGQSNTAMFSENLQAQPWYLHELYSPSYTRWMTMTGNPGRWHTHYFYQSRYIHGMVWHYEDTNQFNGAPAVNPIHKINGGDKFVLTMNSTNYFDLARPSSAHNDGVNISFADGRVNFTRETIDYRVYQGLLTPRGKSSDVPFSEYVLKDDDYL